MFKWKKTASRDSISAAASRDSFAAASRDSFAAASRDSFAASRDSFVVTSPSAMSDTNTGPDTSGLFVQDYRGSNSKLSSQTEKRDAASHPTSVYTPTSSRSHSSSPEMSSKLDSIPYQQVQAPKAPQFVAAVPSPRRQQHHHHHQQQQYQPAPITFAYLELETHHNAFEQNNRMLCARVHELKTKHQQLLSEIKSEEEEKAKFQEHVAVLRKRLGQVTHALEAQRELCSTVDKLIEETEDGYMKIVETSKTILQMLDKDYSQIYKRRTAAIENAFRD